MSPPQKNFQPPGCLSAKVVDLQKKKKKIGSSTSNTPYDASSNVPSNVLPKTPLHTLLAQIEGLGTTSAETPQPSAETPQPSIIQSIEAASQPIGQSQSLGCSSKRKRGMNKNFGLNRQTMNGEKIVITCFDSKTKLPSCPHNRKSWARHLGIIVRDNFNIPHRTAKWSDLVQSTLDSLWKNVKDKFDYQFTPEEQEEDYKTPTIRHMHDMWDNWRCNIKIKHINPHGENVDKIKADRPYGFTQEDWEWLLNKYYLNDSFKKISARNATNRKNMKNVHRTGSKPFCQLEREMASRPGGRHPTIDELYLETRKKKKKDVGNDADEAYEVDADVQANADAMKKIREENPNVSDVDILEVVFGPQSHGSIIGMGSDVLPSKLRSDGSSYKRQPHSPDFKKTVENMAYELANVKERLATSGANRAADLAAHKKERVEDAQNFEKKLHDGMRNFFCQSTSPSTFGSSSSDSSTMLMNAIFTQFWGQSSTMGLSIPPDSVVIPPDTGNEEEEEEDNEEEEE